MSISNRLCKEREPVEYIQCWVPAQHVDAFKGIVPVFRDVVNQGRAVVWGGTGDQYHAYDNMVRLLKEINKNLNTYKTSGVLVVRMNELIKWAQVWENGEARAHRMPEVYPGALPPGQNPPPYAPAPSAPTLHSTVQVRWAQPMQLSEHPLPPHNLWVSRH